MASSSDQNRLDELLAKAANRSANWPHLFGYTIARFAQLHKLNETGLIAQLKCDERTLNALRLCARPDPSPEAFALDILRIADKLHLSAGVLAGIAREVDAAEAFSHAGRAENAILPFSSTHGVLQAARDREQAAGELVIDDHGSDTQAEEGGEPDAATDESQRGEPSNGDQSL